MFWSFVSVFLLDIESSGAACLVQNELMAHYAPKNLSRPKEPLGPYGHDHTESYSSLNFVPARFNSKSEHVLVIEMAGSRQLSLSLLEVSEAP